MYIQHLNPTIDWDQPARELRYCIERTEHDGSADLSGDYDFVYIRADEYTDPAFDIEMWCREWLLRELLDLNPKFLDEICLPAKKIEVVFSSWGEVARIDIASLYASYLTNMEALAKQENED